MSEPYSAADGLVRVYPAREPNGAGLVWAHGGGFAFGDVDMPEGDWVARQLAARGTTVVSVDYRLAPVSGAWASGRGDAPRAGHHYPAASDDMIAAWTWACENASRLRIDITRLAIGGASAGANIAAGAVLRLLGRGGAGVAAAGANSVADPAAVVAGADAPGAEAPTAEAPAAGVPAAGVPVPALVVLAYPTLLAVQPAPDAALRAALDAQPGADRFGPAAVLSMYENYLGGDVTGAPLGAVPGLATAEDVAQFPPTLIVNGEVDELRVSGEAFAATLATAGREVTVLAEAGTEHGHLNRPAEAAAPITIERFARALASLPSPSQSTSSAPPAPSAPPPQSVLTPDRS
ncbi:alpha/beta hydrolase fold domain-containing protein [Microbacterium sp. C7(2022)]|uniref:alpha/beta hydrolase fold domain-containing protein n=1 Tax=Microbacterium sp. C7(2022) TaxID=2992759 RepID=UPI00237A158E|nr:alpha/beta hydrolase fold domain-containing protein [Microbacterium sp. C7(2022)]MDE0546612.1 alpha/beta hydrolase [Microbacterium sp. C7(2022)]